MTENTKNSAEFTIIELIVVMTVFLFIIGAAIGIFISIVKSQKKVLVEQQLVNQVSYVKEYMSKALRAAKVDSIGDYLGNKGDIYLLTHYFSKVLNGNNSRRTSKEAERDFDF